MDAALQFATSPFRECRLVRPRSQQSWVLQSLVRLTLPSSIPSAKRLPSKTIQATSNTKCDYNSFFVDFWMMPAAWMCSPISSLTLSVNDLLSAKARGTMRIPNWLQLSSFFEQQHQQFAKYASWNN